MASEPRVRARALLLAALPLAVGALSAACSSGGSSGSQPVAVDDTPTVTADGTTCRLSSDSVTAGEVVLHVLSTSTTTVTVSVVAQGAEGSGTPPGSSVAIAAGGSGELRTTLQPGEYDVTCAGATRSSAPLSVDGESG